MKPPSLKKAKPVKANPYTKILCYIGIHKPKEFDYIDSRGGGDSICGCARCGKLLG